MTQPDVSPSGRFGYFISHQETNHAFRTFAGAACNTHVLALQHERAKWLRFLGARPKAAPLQPRPANHFSPIRRAFRRLDRLFSQIERILKINQFAIVSASVVDAARESLLIGTG